MKSSNKTFGITIVFISLLMIGCKTTQKTVPKKRVVEKDCCISPYDSFNYIPLLELGAEYRRLDQLKATCCAKKESALSLIMKELGKQLGKKGTHKDKIIEVMGEADIENEQSLKYTLANTKAGLWFGLKNNRVVQYKWLKLP